jgi:dihydroorotate dehydrogenase (fumarate)
MALLETKYLGINLKNPIIVGSSGLTNSVEKIVKLRDAGAGAVVLKSLFEEQINHDVNRTIYSGEGLDYPETLDYVKNYSRNNSVSEYLQLIKDAKQAVDIPVIASINCYSADEWVDFAQQIESAGADALELNLFVLNTNKNSNPADYEDLYYAVSQTVSRVVSIPVVMKLGPYFSNLVSVVDKLSVSGSKGVVLFNRFYEPDIDINNLSLTSAEVFSSPADIRRSLRWIGIVTDKVKGIDIVASTGVHDGDAVIKQLLAGATAVQVCSSIYKNGSEVITRMIKKMESWMEEKGYEKISEFRGSLGYGKIKNPALYERSQFMRYFSKFE